MLRYIGPRLSTGEIERSLIYSGIPAIDEIDDATLTPDQVKHALASGLYERVKEPPKKGEKE